MRSRSLYFGWVILIGFFMLHGGCSKNFAVPVNPSVNSTSLLTPTESPTPVPVDAICYSAPGANGSIPLFKINPDGTALTQITNNSIATFHPSWSPNKSKIVFDGYGSGSSGIYVIDSDGSNLTLLSNLGEAPAWSPDGTRIAFISNAGQVWVMNADGSHATQLTNNPSDLAEPEDIAWSPNSTQLVFNTLSGTKIINADGTNLQNFPILMKYIDWSPDGSQFVFAASTGTVNNTNYWQVFTVNVDGTNLTQLTHTPSSHGGPCWSQNGSKIVFTDLLAGGTLYTMNPDGSDVTLLPNATIYYCYQPCWH